MQDGLKTAIHVPLTTMRLGDSAWEALLEVARFGNPASKSDTQVGARSLETGIWGAYQNVLINMKDIEDHHVSPGNPVRSRSNYVTGRGKLSKSIGHSGRTLIILST